MTLHMLEALRTETAQVRLTLEPLPASKQAGLEPEDPSTRVILPNHFCGLRIHVTNLSCKSYLFNQLSS